MMVTYPEETGLAEVDRWSKPTCCRGLRQRQNLVVCVGRTCRSSKFLVRLWNVFDEKKKKKKATTATRRAKRSKGKRTSGKLAKSWRQITFVDETWRRRHDELQRCSKPISPRSLVTSTKISSYGSMTISLVIYLSPPWGWSHGLLSLTINSPYYTWAQPIVQYRLPYQLDAWDSATSSC